MVTALSVFQLFSHELRRTVSFLAESLEARGERVDWNCLRTETVETEKATSQPLLSKISESLSLSLTIAITSSGNELEDFIKSHGEELLQQNTKSQTGK